jgi:streptomycin 6-kinase
VGPPPSSPLRPLPADAAARRSSPTIPSCRRSSSSAWAASSPRWDYRPNGRSRSKARGLADFISTTWEALDRPCSTRAVDIALEFASERAAAFDRDTAVLVHGDAHEHNTLEDGRGAFKLVDPEGLISEPAHDLAVPMRGLNAELLAGDARRLGLERARHLARLTGADAGAIWQWGFVERVSTGLYVMSLGHEDPGGAEFLAIADLWAEPD